MAASNTFGSRFNDKAEDEKAIQQEELRLRQEIHWLLTKEFPYSCSRIRQTIDECIHYIKRGPGQGRNPEEEEEIADERKPIAFDTVGFASKTHLFGYAVLNGWNVSEAKITVKLQRLNKGAPFKTEISTTPWKLTQLQDAHNYLVLARDDLDTTNFHALSIQQANKIINRIALKIKQAQDQLLMMDTSSINEYHSQMAFLPKLPSNLSMEFSISHKFLDLTLYLVQNMSGPRKANPGAHETIVDQHKQKLYEVLEHITIHKPHKNELREKLLALASITSNHM